MVAALIIYQGYRGWTWTEALVFRTDDGWCQLHIESIGNHCFGDFGTAYNRGGFADIYVPNNILVTGTPLTLSLFELLRLLPYRLSVGLYILAGLSLIIYVCRDALQGLQPLVQVSVTVFCGLLSYGTLTAVDRGNHVMFLVAPAYFLLASEKPRSQLSQAVLLGILIGLKFWGIVFVIPLLAWRRYGVVVKGLIIGAITYLIPIYFFTGDYFTKWNLMLSKNSSREMAAITAPYNLSVNGLVQRTVCVVRSQTWCNTNDPSTHFRFQSAIPILVAVFFMVLLFFTVKFFLAYRDLTTSFALAMPFIAIPDAAPYNTVFAVPAMAAFLKHYRTANREASTTNLDCQLPTQDPPSRGTYVMFSLALVVTLLPIPLYFVTTNMFASSNGQSSPVFRIQYWVVPLVWLGVSLSLIREMIRRRVLSKRCPQ